MITAISWMIRPLVEPLPGGQQRIEVRNLGQCHFGQHDQEQRKQQDSQFH
ncbi:hypothetical protein ACVWWI_001774 [Bradyrhizobium sp. USDA 3686]